MGESSAPKPTPPCVSRQEARVVGGGCTHAPRPHHTQTHATSHLQRGTERAHEKHAFGARCMKRSRSLIWRLPDAPYNRSKERHACFTETWVYYGHVHEMVLMVEIDKGMRGMIVYFEGEKTENI